MIVDEHHGNQRNCIGYLYVVCLLVTRKGNNVPYFFSFGRCSICLGEYSDKEILRIMPTCQHNFHLECIDVWLQKQTTCPICRVSLKDQPGAKPTASPLRTLPQILGHAGSPVNRSPHWILPIHRDRAGGRQNSPASQESLEVIIEIQPQRQ